MRQFVGGIFYMAGGLAIGAVSAFMAIQNAGVEPFRTGTPWISREAGLGGGTGFYVRSHYLLEGRLPPAQGQLTEATAETDNDGQPLTASCSYRLASTGPLPRWWSVATMGSGSDTAALQSTADSDSTIRESDGSAIITASSSPAPGNWLKAPATRRFTLIYSAIPVSGQRGGGSAPPFSITREGC